MSLQSCGSLLQPGNGQLRGGCQTQAVAPVADLAMGAPGTSRDAPLMMGRERAPLSHKAKRGLLCHPGKPLRGIWLQREQAVLGTDHHIVPLLAILDTRDDMNRLAGRLGSGTRAGNWGSWLGGTPARLACRSRADWRRRLLLEQEGEISHLLLQGGNLGLQGGKPLW